MVGRYTVSTHTDTHTHNTNSYQSVWKIIQVILISYNVENQTHHASLSFFHSPRTSFDRLIRTFFFLSFSFLFFSFICENNAVRCWNFVYFLSIARGRPNERNGIIAIVIHIVIIDTLRLFSHSNCNEHIDWNNLFISHRNYLVANQVICVYVFIYNRCYNYNEQNENIDWN